MFDWWEPTSDEEFTTRAQCMINQYDEFITFGDEGQQCRTGGERCLGENIADNGGTKAAYRKVHYLISSTLFYINLPDKRIFVYSYRSSFTHKGPDRSSMVCVRDL